MIKTITNKGTLILVMERGNITRLIEKKRPILVKAEQMQRKDFKGIKEIVIAFYETQEQAIEALSVLFSEDIKIIAQNPE